MDKEEAQRLISLYGTCPTCGAPVTTRVRYLERHGQSEVLEEMVCSADPDHEDEPHSSGWIHL